MDVIAELSGAKTTADFEALEPRLEAAERDARKRLKDADADLGRALFDGADTKSIESARAAAQRDLARIEAARGELSRRRDRARKSEKDAETKQRLAEAERLVEQHRRDEEACASASDALFEAIIAREASRRKLDQLNDDLAARGIPSSSLTPTGALRVPRDRQSYTRGRAEVSPALEMLAARYATAIADLHNGTLRRGRSNSIAEGRVGETREARTKILNAVGGMH